MLSINLSNFKISSKKFVNAGIWTQGRLVGIKYAILCAPATFKLFQEILDL